jgi:hypothetical protein
MLESCRSIRHNGGASNLCSSSYEFDKVIKSVKVCRRTKFRYRAREYVNKSNSSACFRLAKKIRIPTWQLLRFENRFDVILKQMFFFKYSEYIALKTQAHDFSTCIRFKKNKYVQMYFACAWLINL